MPDNSLDHIELRSEEVQEILTKVPHWMIRWGNVLFLTIILMLMLISWFVKYPDIITSEAIITTQIPQQKGYAQITGTIDTILVEDNQEVNKNQVLSLLENAANYKDVYKLKSVIDTITTLNSKSFRFPLDSLPILFLGDIEPQFALFQNSYMQYKLNKELQTFSYKASANPHSINKLEALTHRDLNLFKDEITLFKDVIQSFYQLKKSIKDWEQLYVLKSNINGNVTFSNYWNTNKTVNQDDLVFTIIPSENSSFIAKLKAPAQSFGKIKLGQNVNIKIENYPDTEFGILNGTVKNISQIPNAQGFYHVNVEFPNKLITSYKKEIDFKQEMRGTAEIVTEDLRLIERFFYQFRETIQR